MINPRPNLFIIGAAKSGTTSLHYFLGRHPAIFMCDPKEPGFFADGFDGYPKDEEWYLSLFEKGAKARYRGDSSTHYTKLPVYTGAAEGIADYCASARVIYLMRDPIDRAISQYWHYTRQVAEFRSPLRAMKNNPVYKAFGDYARQLKPYFDHFPQKQIYTATFEELIRKPQKVSTEIFDWLAVDSSLVPKEFPAENRVPNIITRLVPGQLLGNFLHRSATWNSISPRVPRSIKNLGKKLTTRQVSPSETAVDDVIAYLRPWAREVVSETSEFLGRDFPEWTTTLDSD